MKKICGIYKITSPSGKIYIGQSIDIKKRFSYYKGVHCKYQKRLLNSIKKYGFDKHKFEIIDYCLPEELNEKEKYYVDLYQTFNSKEGLNLLDGGGRKVFSDETKKKISDTLKRKKINVGKVVSLETREKMRQARLGKKHSQETKEKMSIAQSGEKHSQYGKPKSDATKEKISKKHLGKKLSEETRNKMKKRTGAKNGFYGKIHSKESKIKMSNTKKVKYGNVL